MRLIDDLKVELSVVLGSNHMPVHQLLRMGRGAVIALETHANEEVTILANEIPVAIGSVVIRGDRIAVEVTHALTQADIDAGVI